MKFEMSVRFPRRDDMYVSRYKSGRGWHTEGMGNQETR